MKPKLSLAMLLSWADAHYERTGQWPTVSSGCVFESVQENWRDLDVALRLGLRGFPCGGSCLRKVIAMHRDYRPNLTEEQILTWADEYLALKGKWPSVNSGRVFGVEGETWIAINRALVRGNRGLLGGSSLSKLLNKKRRTCQTAR